MSCILGQSVSSRRQSVLTLDPHRAVRCWIGSEIVLYPAGWFHLSFQHSVPSVISCMYFHIVGVLCLYMFVVLVILCNYMPLLELTMTTLRTRSYMDWPLAYRILPLSLSVLLPLYSIFLQMSVIFSSAKSFSPSIWVWSCLIWCVCVHVCVCV